MQGEQKRNRGKTKDTADKSTKRLHKENQSQNVMESNVRRMVGLYPKKVLYASGILVSVHGSVAAQQNTE